MSDKQLLTSIRGIVKEEIKKGKAVTINLSRMRMHSLPNFGTYAKQAKTK
ncbi:MAG: hypothetical protein JWO92_2544 [Chitinophagaceae bacterium]|nr:hypothetical protein [Chitinophagaceae bacterium]